MNEAMLEAAKTAAVTHITGPTILLGSGTYFDYLAPEQTPMTIEDVAYGLAFNCRFAGQCVSRFTGRRVFYSVAEHCVRMSRAIAKRYAYQALMHELGEGATGVDMTSPLKTLCPDYKLVEKRCDAALRKQFNVSTENANILKHWDLIMLATERRDLMAWKGETWSWLPGIEPLEEEIIPWAPEFAAQAFLSCYEKLRSSNQ